MFKHFNNENYTMYQGNPYRVEDHNQCDWHVRVFRAYMRDKKVWEKYCKNGVFG